MARPHVVIIGGGFGGLDAARALRRRAADVTLVDRRNHHCSSRCSTRSPPRAVAGATSPAPIRCDPARGSERSRAARHGRPASTGRRRPGLARRRRRLAYDYLIVGDRGATHCLLRPDDWASRAPGLKTLDDASTIRRRMLLAFERAERATDPARQRLLLTFVVVGGGPTGVELAGALAEIARHTLRANSATSIPRSARVCWSKPGRTCSPRSPRTSPARRDGNSRASASTCALGAPVTDIDADGVATGRQRSCPRRPWSGPQAWRPRRCGAMLGAPLDRAGRVQVRARPSRARPSRRLRRRRPGRADAGETASRCPASRRPPSRWARLRRAQHPRAPAGRPRRRVRLQGLGHLATIGRARGGRRTSAGSGSPACSPGWPGWSSTSLFLIGFRNRLVVLLNWWWAYVTFQSGARLIAGPGRASHDAVPVEKVRSSPAHCAACENGKPCRAADHVQHGIR